MEGVPKGGSSKSVNSDTIEGGSRREGGSNSDEKEGGSTSDVKERGSADEREAGSADEREAEGG